MKRSMLHRLKISVGETEIIAEDRRRFQSVVLRMVAAAAAASGVVAAAVAAVVVDGRHRGRDGGRASAAAWRWASAAPLLPPASGSAWRSGCAWRSRRGASSRPALTGSEERPMRWVESELAA